MHCHALLCTSKHCHALLCTALHCCALPCTVVHFRALPCTVVHCHAMLCTSKHCHALLCMFRIILDRGHFDLSSTPPSLLSPVLIGSHRSVSGLQASLILLLFKLLCFIIIIQFNANILEASQKTHTSPYHHSVQLMEQSGLAQTGRIITRDYHTHF